MKKLVLLMIHLPLGFMVAAQDFNILKYGAVSDTTRLSTEAINRAISACSKSGGGRVVIPAGNYKSGTITMKNDVELYLESGSILHASTNQQDFPRAKEPEYTTPHSRGGGYRSAITPQNKKGAVNNIHLNQLSIKNAGPTACAITGYPGAWVTEITLRDIFIEHNGGGTYKDTSLKVPENSSGYPLNKMFGRKILPACGFYIRHVKNINLYNVQVTLAQADVRPAFVLDDVDKAVLREVNYNPLTTLNHHIIIANSKEVSVFCRDSEFKTIRLIHSSGILVNDQSILPSNINK